MDGTNNNTGGGKGDKNVYHEYLDGMHKASTAATRCYGEILYYALCPSLLREPSSVLLYYDRD